MRRTSSSLVGQRHRPVHQAQARRRDARGSRGRARAGRSRRRRPRCASPRRSARAATTRRSPPTRCRRSWPREVEKSAAPVATPLAIDRSNKPFVILMVGVNGSGKTTTIGKLAAEVPRRRACRHARGRRHVPRRRHRAAEGLGRARRRAGRGARRRAPTRPVSPSTRCAQAKASGHRRAAHRHRRAAAEQGRAHGRARKDRAGASRRSTPSAPHATLLVLDATVGQNALSPGRDVPASRRASPASS